MERWIDAALVIHCPAQHAIEELVYYTNGADDLRYPKTPLQSRTIQRALEPLLEVLQDGEDPSVWRSFNSAIAAILAYGHAREEEAKDPVHL